MQSWEVASRCRASLLWALTPCVHAQFPDADAVALLGRIASETSPAAAEGVEFDEFLTRTFTRLDHWVRQERKELVAMWPEAQPLDAVTDIFTSISAQVADWYAALGGGVDPCELLVEQRSARASGGAPVSGEFSPFLRRVRLFVDPALLEWQSTLGISVVLMHELICHAGAGSDSSGAQLFSEGLMNDVSVSFLLRWARQQQMPGPAVAHLAQVAGQLDRRRRDGGLYKDGRFARTALLELVRRDVRTEGRDSEILVDRLLLGLNASDRPIERKDALVSQLAQDQLAVGVADLLVTAALARGEERTALVQELLHG